MFDALTYQEMLKEIKKKGKTMQIILLILDLRLSNT